MKRKNPTHTRCVIIITLDRPLNCTAFTLFGVFRSLWLSVMYVCYKFDRRYEKRGAHVYPSSSTMNFVVNKQFHNKLSLTICCCCCCCFFSLHRFVYIHLFILILRFILLLISFAFSTLTCGLFFRSFVQFVFSKYLSLVAYGEWEPIYFAVNIDYLLLYLFDSLETPAFCLCLSPSRLYSACAHTQER